MEESKNINIVEAVDTYARYYAEDKQKAINYLRALRRNYGGAVAMDVMQAVMERAVASALQDATI